MNNDVITDLKQFITTTVSQQLSLQTDKLRYDIKKLDKKIDGISNNLGQKIDNLSLGVASALDASNEEHDKQLKNHEIRLRKLEQKPA